MRENILITGGAGYIGTHICISLIEAGYTVTVLDNYSNSHPEALNRVQQITGQSLAQIHGDVRNHTTLLHALRESQATAVIHCAGLKAVGESSLEPLRYYDHNVLGTLRLIEVMAQCHVKTLIFSSSATVYGNPQFLPLTEGHPLSPTNPYGRSKLMVENILLDVYAADTSWRIGMLRYFNPVGAHPSGHIGEDPQDTPNNLLPFVAQVAVGRQPYLRVWGDDYNTPDGTGVRDYIHVMDLANGHLHALRQLHASTSGQCAAVNLGTGIGYSVLDVVRAFEQASGRSVPYQIMSRRQGDVANCFASPQLANDLLGWKAQKDLLAMCTDAWHWQSNNPQGYSDSP
jgi:UDP-glucose 4-epimerase